MPSPEYIQLIEEGAFPRQIDPWSERGHYFHQLHGHMITYILDEIARPLRELGYYAGREASIQILERMQPNIFVQSKTESPQKQGFYTQAAAAAALELGIVLEEYRPELDRVFIRASDTGSLITVLELVSPNNKTRDEQIQAYRERREQLLAQGVHCVEINLSRSVRRLLDNPVSENYPYHIAIHLHNESSRFIGIELNEALKSFALPLRREIVPVSLNQIYRQAYARLAIAEQILVNNHYSEAHLSFPSLINETQRASLLNQLEAWKNALKAAE